MPSDACRDHSGHSARLEALEKNEDVLFTKMDSLSKQLWLIIGGIILANGILIVGAAYFGAHVTK